VPVADLVPPGDPDLTLFVAVTLTGLLVGAAGHLVRSTALIVAGIALVFLGTLVLPLLVVGTGTG